MRNFHIRTLADLGDDFDLRVWCLTCARGTTIAAATVVEKFEAKGWPLDLVTARAHFRCSTCLSSGAILLLPASKPPPPPPPPPEPVYRCYTAEQAVAAIYHHHRAEAKRAKRRDPGGYGLDGGRRTMGRWWK